MAIYVKVVLMRFAFLLVLLIILAQASSHTQRCSSTLNGCVLDIVNVVPSKNTGATSRADEKRLYDPKLLGDTLIDANVWGLEQYLGMFSGFVTVEVAKQGVVWFKGNLDLSNVSLETWRVIAYPELIYGVKPWTPELKTNMSRYLNLPIRLADLPRVQALIDYAVHESSSPYNVAFDIWILRSPNPRTPREGDVEIMIWVHRQAANFTPQPAGKRIGVVEVEVLIDGVHRVEKFEVWYHERVGDGWRYIAYVLADSKPYREVGLDITHFIERAADLLKLTQEDYYIYSIEFGYELFYNTKVVFSAAVYRYIIVITNTKDPTLLSQYTQRSNPVVAWIVPWGHPVDLEALPPIFTPGIVVAYDVECGLCTSSLQAWFKASLEQIKRLKENGRQVFVNIFPEVYHPTWTWRGHLTRLELNEIVFEKLREVLEDGEQAYIGFSELTACVNSNKCRDSLVQAYRYLRSIFPAARLFYYGSGGDDVEALLDLHKRAGLDLVGLDVWSYKHEGGRILVADYLSDKLLRLNKTLKIGELIIGEIGFRVNDREAYVEPWNKNRPIVHEEGIHVEYYAQALEHILSLSRPSVIGIWSWNDDAFSIMKEFGLHKTIEEVLVNRGLIRRTQCDQKFLSDKVNAGVMEWWIQKLIKLFLAMAVGLSVTVIVVKKFLKKKT